MTLHPYLPTIVPVDSCPQGKVFLVPAIERVNIVAPDGTTLVENIEYHRKQCALVYNLSLPSDGKETV